MECLDGFEIQYSFEMNDRELRAAIMNILELDAEGYPSEFQGNFSSVMDRVLSNRDCLIMVRFQEKIVGYICFFPICESLFNEIMNSSNMYDNDIVGTQIIEYGLNSNLFIISIVISDKYRNGEVIKILNNSFKRWIANKIDKGITFQNFLAYSISTDGVKWLHNFGFEPYKRITESEVLYVMEKYKIEDLV